MDARLTQITKYLTDNGFKFECTDGGSEGELHSIQVDDFSLRSFDDMAKALPKQIKQISFSGSSTNIGLIGLFKREVI